MNEDIYIPLGGNVEARSLALALALMDSSRASDASTSDISAFSFAYAALWPEKTNVQDYEAYQSKHKINKAIKP